LACREVPVSNPGLRPILVPVAITWLVLLPSAAARRRSWRVWAPSSGRWPSWAREPSPAGRRALVAQRARPRRAPGRGRNGRMKRNGRLLRSARQPEPFPEAGRAYHGAGLKSPPQRLKLYGSNYVYHPVSAARCGAGPVQRDGDVSATSRCTVPNLSGCAGTGLRRYHQKSMAETLTIAPAHDLACGHDHIWVAG